MKRLDLVLVVLVVAVGTWLFSPGEPPVEERTPTTSSPEMPLSTETPPHDPRPHVGPPRRNPVPYEKMDLAASRDLFMANCAPCHGDKGRGEGPASGALDPPPNDLTDARAYKYGTDDWNVYRTTRYGIPDTGQPPWDGRLTDNEMWSIVNYLRYLRQGLRTAR